MIPKTTYPTAVDTNESLFLVGDGLRVVLAEDYNPGDTVITVVGDEDTMRNFNSTGIITLTEQCSEPELRAISFYYSSRSLTTFEGLEILPGFIDVIKSKGITNVTQNVMSIHHNNLKDALIRIEQFAGRKGEVGKGPLLGTMEERINYLRNIVLKPKAWFKISNAIGIAPLTVYFTDQSFRLGTDGSSHEVKHFWDFGDNTDSSDLSIIPIADGVVPEGVEDVIIDATCPTGKACVIQKTYTKPGIYDISLTVTNDFGSDTVTFKEAVNVRYSAPELAIVEIIEAAGQDVTAGIIEDGKYISTPKIRATINSLINLGIKTNGGSPIMPGQGKTYGGEVLNSNNEPIDPILYYTWNFSDDLNHNNTSTTKALFGVGGYYDLVLRTDTKYGSYRITNYPNAFDIIENTNLWLWNFKTSSTQINSHEFGLLSETFKAKTAGSELDLSYLGYNDGFLTTDQQRAEFARNNGCAQIGTSNSGASGSAMLFWASGRSESDPASSEKINFCRYNGFADLYTYPSNPAISINRPWNWVGFSSTEESYFILGGLTSPITSFSSPTNQTKSKLDFYTSTVTSSTLTDSNYKNGATDLKQNSVTYNPDTGLPDQGHMSVYRSTWHNNAGYFLKNEGAGAFFRIKSFYKTSGNTTESFIDIRKLPDMLGSAKVEGQLASLSQGVYFFSNSGSVSAYGSSSGTWTTGGVATTSAAFRSLQDTDKTGFDNATNTLLVATDNEKTAYLSFDYSEKCFIKFNELDTTFSSSSYRPTGDQWQMFIF
jgi:PKD repeat protein